MNVSGRFIHRSVQTLDSGIQLDLLQEYIFINLDIYFKILQNNIVENETDAWLMFLGTDSPDQIISLLEQYPWFEDLYRDLYTACRNTEGVMDMFSEELRILDRNTVQYMIDEMEEEIKKKENQLKEQEDRLKKQDGQLKVLKEQNSQLEEQKRQLETVCRSFVAESRESGGDRTQAAQILCDRIGMDEEAALDTVNRLWGEE